MSCKLIMMITFQVPLFLDIGSAKRLETRGSYTWLSMPINVDSLTGVLECQTKNPIEKSAHPEHRYSTAYVDAKGIEHPGTILLSEEAIRALMAHPES